MKLTSYLQDRRLTIALCGEIDHHTAKEMMAEIANKIDSYMPSVCILDYHDVTFMDSSGIAVVIRTIRKMRELEGKTYLQNLPLQAAKVLHAAGIEKIVEIREEAHNEI